MFGLCGALIYTTYHCGEGGGKKTDSEEVADDPQAVHDGGVVGGYQHEVTYHC